MRKITISAASCYNKKYYIDPCMEESLPTMIKEELKAITSSKAEKIHCIFMIGFYENGDVYIETINNENDFDFDEIGSRLEIEKIKKEKAELFNSLSLWYKTYGVNLFSQSTQTEFKMKGNKL